MSAINQTTNWIGGTAASFLGLSIMPTSSGVDELLKIIASGIMALGTQLLLMHFQNKYKQQSKNDEDVN